MRHYVLLIVVVALCFPAFGQAPPEIPELFKLMSSGTPAELQAWLDDGGDPNTVFQMGPSRTGNALTAMVTIAANGRPGSFQKLKILLKAGADPNKADLESGKTPLHRAAFKASEAIVLALLDAGADPNKRDNRGRTPYDYALVSGNRYAVLTLEAKTGFKHPERERLLTEAHNRMIRLKKRRQQ